MHRWTWSEQEDKCLQGKSVSMCTDRQCWLLFWRAKEMCSIDLWVFFESKREQIQRFIVARWNPRSNSKQRNIILITEVYRSVQVAGAQGELAVGGCRDGVSIRLHWLQCIVPSPRARRRLLKSRGQQPPLLCSHLLQRKSESTFQRRYSPLIVPVTSAAVEQPVCYLQPSTNSFFFRSIIVEWSIMCSNLRRARNSR